LAWLQWRAPASEIPREQRLEVSAELHVRSRVPRRPRDLDRALGDPRVRDIAPRLVVRYGGRHAHAAADRLWNAPRLEGHPTLEVPREWIADFRDNWRCEVRLWPGALCLLGRLPDGRWEIALVSGRPTELVVEGGQGVVQRGLEHRVAWAAKQAGREVVQTQWVEFHPDRQGKTQFEDLFRRAGWFFVEPWAGERPRGALAINRSEVV